MLPRTTTTRTNARTKKTVPSTELCEGLESMRPELFCRALKMTRSAEAAEDLVQDTVVRAIEFRKHFQRGTNLRAWVHQILFSIFITRCRRLRREREALAMLGSAPGAWTLKEGKLEAYALSPAVARAFSALPLSHRAAMVLVDLEEMSYADAAKLIGVPVGTVMSRLSRGRSMLADALRTPAPLAAAA